MLPRCENCCGVAVGVNDMVSEWRQTEADRTISTRVLRQKKMRPRRGFVVTVVFFFVFIVIALFQENDKVLIGHSGVI